MLLIVCLQYAMQCHVEMHAAGLGYILESANVWQHHAEIPKLSLHSLAPEEV